MLTLIFILIPIRWRHSLWESVFFVFFFLQCNWIFILIPIRRCHSLWEPNFSLMSTWIFILLPSKCWRSLWESYFPTWIFIPLPMRWRHSLDGSQISPIKPWNLNQRTEVLQSLSYFQICLNPYTIIAVTWHYSPKGYFVILFSSQWFVLIFQ